MAIFRVRTSTLTALCTLSVALVLTHCWIVRLPCTDESETSPFTVELQGYSLENHVVASYEGMALDECKQTCYDDPRCRSINHSVNNRCEISNKINETANAGHLKAKSGHTYFSTNYRTKNMGILCRTQNPCVNETYCIDNCRCPGYKCVKCPKYHEVRYEQYCQVKDFMNRFYELKNIAVGKTTIASSTNFYYQFIVFKTNYYSRYANDGSRACSNGLGAVRHFSSIMETNPYWQVDLDRVAVVLNVTVAKFDTDRNINPFDIRVGNNRGGESRKNALCVKNAALGDGEIKNFTCPETEGKYVSVHLERMQQLKICEVEVYGIYL